MNAAKMIYGPIPGTPKSGPIPFGAWLDSLPRGSAARMIGQETGVTVAADRLLSHGPDALDREPMRRDSGWIAPERPIFVSVLLSAPDGHGGNGVATDATATIDEVVTVTGETITETDDGRVSVRLSVRLKTGAAEYVGADSIGSAVGESYRLAYSAALKSAETAARAARAVSRERTAVLSREPFGPSLLSGAEYARLSRLCRRWIYGSAHASGSRSAGAFVRAGLSAAGMPIDVDALSDATQNAGEIIIGWRRNGLPESIAERLSERSATESESVIFGSAARDGVRRVTAHKRQTAAARAATVYASRLYGLPSGSWDGVSATGAPERLSRPCPVRVQSSSYVGTGRADEVTETVLTARGTDGALRFPMLARMVLADGSVGSVAAVCRSLGVSETGRSWMRVRSALLSEYANLTGVGSATDDSTETAARQGWHAAR